MKEQRHRPARESGSAKGKKGPVADPGATSAPGPEPSLVSRVARAEIGQAYERGVPPFDGDTRPEATSAPRPETSPSQDGPALDVDLGGRVNAARATHGRGNRAGAAAAGIPVQSVGAALSTPRPPAPGGASPDEEPRARTHTPKRDDAGDAEPD